MIIESLIIALMTVGILSLGCLWWRLRSCNQSPLLIETFDGSNCPYHPSVLYFSESWNGYRYWMVETPFSPSSKPYRDRWECPSIHVSQDGINWHSPFVNPIDDLSVAEVENLDYFSDPHLVMKDGVLECWYRVTRRRSDVNFRSDVRLLRKTSFDGKTWSTREELVRFAEDSSPLGNMLVSPAVIYIDGYYHMWYVDSEDHSGVPESRRIVHAFSSDGYEWESVEMCALQGPEILPWHIDVNRIDGIYWLVIYDFNTLTLWRSTEGKHFYYVKELLRPSAVPGSFYENGLYRSSLVAHNHGVRLYFSADDRKRTYIGLMEGKTIDSLKVISINGVNSTVFYSFWKFLSNKYTSCSFIIKKLFNYFV